MRAVWLCAGLSYSSPKVVFLPQYVAALPPASTVAFTVSAPNLAPPQPTCNMLAVGALLRLSSVEQLRKSCGH